MTFSIVARDAQTGALGVASATAGPAVGALVIHGAANVGAIATQAMTNPLYGVHGLRYLRQGMTAVQTLEKLLDEDSNAEQRQLMIVDRSGGVARWNGKLCGEYAASQSIDGGAIGGNLLAGEATLCEMQREYQNSARLPFADRLLAAMNAGAAAGGDRRGLHSAALKIWLDREYATLDLRADWSDAPLSALAEILHQTRSSPHREFFAALPKGCI